MTKLKAVPATTPGPLPNFIGLPVRLRGLPAEGCPVMTIMGTRGVRHGDNIERVFLCQWFDTSLQLHQHEFPADSLVEHRPLTMVPVGMETING